MSIDEILKHIYTARYPNFKCYDTLKELLQKK